MSKFSKKLISSIVPAANTAGMYSAVEQLQNLTALAITAINFCADSSGNANGLNDDTAINTAGGFVKLTGSGFTSATIVYINGISVTKYYLSNTNIVATVPAAAAGTTYSLMIFNGSTVGSIWASGISYSGFPSWTTTSGTSNTLTLSTQLVAVGDAPLTYTFVSGTLPPNCTISSSGLLSGTVTGVGTNTIYTFTVAVTDAQNQNVSQSIVYTLIVSDAYYRYNSLHITGDSNPTWITDASTSALAFTATGSTQATTFSPLKAGYYGNSFDGTGNSYLSIPDNAALTPAGDFTIEFWVYPSVTNILTMYYSKNYGLQIYSTGTAAAATFQIALSSNNTGSYFTNFASTIPAPVNTWAHIALYRSGNNYYLSVNGTPQLAVTSASAYNGSTNPIVIGNWSNFAYPVTGYMSNVRHINGTALYGASNFTPSTTPFTAVTNTAILTCQSNRFVDNANNFTITSGTATKVVSSNPFNLPAGLAAYGAGYFNGSSYISTPTNTAFNFGTGDFTIEMWVYPQSFAGYNTLVEARSSGTASSYGLFIELTTGKLYWYDASGIQLSSSGLTLNNWAHVAVSRTSGVLKLFINGVQVYSNPNTNAQNPTGNFVIGRNIESSPVYFNGYISNFRVVKDTAVYTAAFTPPIAPLTAITNTSLLTLQTNSPHNNSQFRDSSANNALITCFGNSTQGSFSPFIKQYPYSTTAVGGSAYFDGTGDYLTAPTNSSYGALATNFTVEAWVYPISWPALGSYSAILYISGTSIWFGLNDVGFGLRQGGTGNIISYTTKPTIGTWTHVAIARVGTACTLYYNGVSVATATSSASFSAGTAWIAADETPGNYFTGYLSDLRLVKGTAVYTTNFTPPTAPLIAIPGTALLLPFTNAAIYDNTMLNNFETVGSAQISTSVFKYGTGALKFNGTTDYLPTPAKTALTLGSGDFTIECWIYPTTGGGAQYFIGQCDSAGANASVLMYKTPASKLGCWVYYPTAINIISTATLSSNVWTHVALVRNGSTLRQYINGVQDGTDATIGTSAIFTSSNAFSIGAAGEYITTRWTGYLDDVRITKGICRYPSGTTFTPPTSALSALSPTGTSILPAKSLRFRSSASAYLNKTFGVPSTQTTYTISAWIKRGTLSAYTIFAAGSVGTNDYSSFQFNTNTSLAFWLSNGTVGEIVTTHLFRDPAAWYHVMVAVDTTQTVASNRMKMYINGTQITSFSTATYPTQNSTASFNRSSTVHAIGALYSGTYNQLFDGEMAEVNFVDGLALEPTMFGAYSTYGQWLPISYAGYSGANGFYLPFTNTISTTTLVADSSGNANNWTPNNISLTTGSTYDSLNDVPTLTSATAANYAVLNPLDKSPSLTISNGNLTQYTTATTYQYGVRSSIRVSSGKWYWETFIVNRTSGIIVGINGTSLPMGENDNAFAATPSYGYNSVNGNKFVNGVSSAYGASYTSSAVIGIALDMDAGTLTFYKDNVSQGTAATGISGSFAACNATWNSELNANFGQQPFTYTPPSGFVALNTYNI